MNETWVVPCSLKFLDITAHFKKTDSVIWKRSPSIEIGDTVFIYVGAPISAIKYHCVVERTEIPDDELDQNSYAILRKASSKQKYMSLKLVGEFDDIRLSYANLKLHGLGQVQIQARADRKLKTYLSMLGY